MKINKLLTPYNHNTGCINRIKYIVIHYVGALGGAKANCIYYAGGNRKASAHYYVDFDGSIWQSVEDKNIAWHCGGKKYPNTKGGTYYGVCTNDNSIGIEMCVRNKGSQADTSRDWYFEDATVMAAIQLTKELMEKYSVLDDHVIRHYDVVGKICPNPYVYNEGKHTWTEFKSAICSTVKSGWHFEENRWRFYLGDTGDYVKSDWYQWISEKDGKKYWSFFLQNGYAVQNDFYNYKGTWYYFDDDCVMQTSKWISWKGIFYYVNKDGMMETECYVESADKNLYYWLDKNGVWIQKYNTPFPDLTRYRIAE